MNMYKKKVFEVIMMRNDGTKKEIIVKIERDVQEDRVGIEKAIQKFVREVLNVKNVEEGADMTGSMSN